MRRTGKTTRIVDRCIQELFTNGLTYVYDEDRGVETTHRVMDIFKRRLILEHPNTKYVERRGRFDDIFCYKVELHNL